MRLNIHFIDRIGIFQEMLLVLPSDAERSLWSRLIHRISISMFPS